SSAWSPIAQTRVGIVSAVKGVIQKWDLAAGTRTPIDLGQPCEPVTGRLLVSADGSAIACYANASPTILSLDLLTGKRRMFPLVVQRAGAAALAPNGDVLARVEEDPWNRSVLLFPGIEKWRSVDPSGPERKAYRDRATVLPIELASTNVSDLAISA